MSLEILLKMKQDAYEAGIPEHKIEMYISWKQKFQELGIPMPNTLDEDELQHVFETYAMFMSQEEDTIEEVEDEQEDET